MDISDAPHNSDDDFGAYEDANHDRGLTFDVNTIFARRHALKLMGGAGLLALVGCASTSTTTATGTSGATGPTTSAAGTSSTSAAASATNTAVSADPASSSTSASAACVSADIPEETVGPYPGDGSNGVNILTASGIVRSDIRSSFGTSTTTAAGVPLTITLRIQDTASCTPLAGAAVYLWHCNIDGNYSLYSKNVLTENYLRGVQEAAADGTVTFTSIFPGAYSGRWPHVHFEVYKSVAEATAAGQIVATSQLALPQDICNLVYATDGYSQSVENLTRISLATDNVFGDDGGVLQIGTVTGTVADGFTATLDVGV